VTDIDTIEIQGRIEELAALDGEQVTREVLESMVCLWREQKKHRMALDKVAHQAKSVESVALKWLVHIMHTQEWEGVVIDGRITGVKAAEVPDVIDKEEFLDYVRKTGELDLLQFRPAVRAINGRMEDGVDVPGISIKEVPTLFDRKA